MARRTRDELERDARAAETRANLLDCTLTAVLLDAADATERQRVSPDQRVELRAYHLKRAHGGIVVRIDHIAGQRATVTAFYLDDMLAAYRESYDRYATPIRTMLYELSRTRNYLLGLTQRRCANCNDAACESFQNGEPCGTGSGV